MLVNYALSFKTFDVDALSEIHAAYDCEIESAIVIMGLDANDTQQVIDISRKADNIQSLEFYERINTHIVSTPIIGVNVLDNLLNTTAEDIEYNEKTDDVIGIAIKRSKQDLEYSDNKFFVSAESHPFIAADRRSNLIQFITNNDFPDAQSKHRQISHLLKTEFMYYIGVNFDIYNQEKAKLLADQLYKLSSKCINKQVKHLLNGIDFSQTMTVYHDIDKLIDFCDKKLKQKSEKANQGE